MALFFTGGCGDDSDIARYRKAKVPQAEVDLAVDSSSGVKWEKPGNWFPQKPGSMRLASFSIPVKGQLAECFLVKLDGNAGGLAANVNRWRDQIGLAPLPRNEAISSLIAISDGKTPFLTTKIVNEQRPESVLLVSVFQQPTEALYVKLTAPMEVIADLELIFIAFCQTIEFDADTG